MRIRKGVIGVVVNGDEFLVLERKHMWRGWEFVKGGLTYMEEGGMPCYEDEENAVKREIMEETGLDVDILNKFHERVEYEHPEHYKNEFGIDMSSHAIFLVNADSRDVKLSFEHSNFKWLTYDEARELLTHDEQKRALDIAAKFLKEQKSIDDFDF
ncbi:MAG: NUDIX domain-containing protein [Candidatus Aenigmatarchaeota archaeon]